MLSFNRDPAVSGEQKRPRLPANFKIKIFYVHAHGKDRTDVELALPCLLTLTDEKQATIPMAITEDYEWWVYSQMGPMSQAISAIFVYPELDKRKFTCLGCHRVATEHSYMGGFVRTAESGRTEIGFQMTVTVHCGLPACYFINTQTRKSLVRELRVRQGELQLTELPSFRACSNVDCNGGFPLPANQWCGRCKVMRYCSKECQVQDYGKHKRECKAMAAARRDATASRASEQ